MKRLIDISDEDYEVYKRLSETRIVGSAIQRIVDSTPLPEGAEILTAEAYSDLCLRASKEKSKWNVIKKRPMDAEEREELSEELGYDIADEDAFAYYNIPEEGKEVFITTSWGSVTTDTIEYDVGFYWEEHDMEDVVAWTPLPEPYKEGAEE